MVIDESDDEDAGAGEENVEGDAYRESLTSVDGFRRGPTGKVKFNKDTKKRRREAEEADGDVEMADAEQKSGKRNKRKAEPKFGHEFKAKVSPTGRCLTVRGAHVPCRRLAETSKRAVWIHTRICPFRRLRKSSTAEPVLASRASAE